jgi:hypothetical protein
MDQWAESSLKNTKIWNIQNLHQIQHCCIGPQRPICGVFFLAPFTAASCCFLRTNQKYTSTRKVRRGETETEDRMQASEKRLKTKEKIWCPEPVFVDLLRSPGIDSQPGGTVRQPYLSYRPARLHRLPESIPRNQFLGSINVYKHKLCFANQEFHVQ